MAADSILKTAAELITALNSVGVIQDVDGGSSTTTDAAATGGGGTAGDTSLSVADESGFQAGDLIRIGSGESYEVAEVEATSTGSLTLVSPLFYDQDSGVDVVEQERVDLGHVAEGGADLNVSEDVFEAGAATSAKVLVRKTVSISQAFTFPLIGWSANTFARAFGIPTTAIGGSGTEADPYVVALADDLIKSQLNTSVYGEAVREDGDIVEIQGWNLTVDLNKSANFSRNSVAELPFGGDVKTLNFIRYTPA